MKWKEITPAKTRTFQLDEEPELIHIIRTGFAENSSTAYIVVYEDAHEQMLGKTEVCSKEEIKKQFGIEL